MYTRDRVRVLDGNLISLPVLHPELRSTIFSGRNDDRGGPNALGRLDASGVEHCVHALLDEFVTLWTGTVRSLAKRACSRLELDTMGEGSYLAQVKGTHVLLGLQHAENFLAIRSVLGILTVHHLTLMLRGFPGIGLDID